MIQKLLPNLGTIGNGFLLFLIHNKLASTFYKLTTI